jgi:hypothetical protein
MDNVQNFSKLIPKGPAFLPWLLFFGPCFRARRCSIFPYICRFGANQKCRLHLRVQTFTIAPLFCSDLVDTEAGKRE